MILPNSSYGMLLGVPHKVGTEFDLDPAVAPRLEYPKDTPILQAEFWVSVLIWLNSFLISVLPPILQLQPHLRENRIFSWCPTKYLLKCFTPNTIANPSLSNWSTSSWQGKNKAVSAKLILVFIEGYSGALDLLQGCMQLGIMLLLSSLKNEHIFHMT